MSEPVSRAKVFQLRAPPSWWRFAEIRALGEAAALVPAAPWLLSQPKGQGERVIVIPGFATGDKATSALRGYLNAMGYQAEGWGLGVNRGAPEADAERMVERLDNTTDGPVSLIGWSLGGVVARLIARHRPHRVQQIITLGTPVEGGPKYTAAGEIFAKRSDLDLDAFEAQVHRINAEGLQVPLTIIYSRTDGIVGWRAAVDRYNPHAQHVPLRVASHIGLVFNPVVWRTIARTLAKARRDEVSVEHAAAPVDPSMTESAPVN